MRCSAGPGSPSSPGQAVLNIALGRLGVGDDVALTVNSIVPALLVAALYMAGGAMWNDRAQFALGAWIAVSTVVAAAAGPPGLLLVMSLAGGGGMLAAAAGPHARGGRRTGRSVTPSRSTPSSTARLGCGS